MKITTQIISFVLFVVMTGCNSSNDSITGLWLITHVQAGDQEMTPTAKWTNIKADMTYESGNGWLKSSEGTYTFNAPSRKFLPKETSGLGLIDPYGSFEVSFLEDGMTWRRNEEAADVVVTLKRIEVLPRAPADDVQGLWDLTAVEVDGADSTNKIDPDNKHFIFIKWDKSYLERTSAGDRQTGYWHMNGHHPELTFLPHTPGNEQTSWTVKTNEGKTLILSNVSDENVVIIRTYTRTNAFPE